MVERYAPPSVLVNADYTLVHVSEHAGRYLQQPGGEPTNNLLKRIHPALRLELTSALYGAMEKQRSLRVSPLRIQVGGEVRHVGLHVLRARVPLEIVLRNLSSNAIKHHTRLDGHVAVTAQDQGEYVEFAVVDDGPGIAAPYHSRIFQLFQTLKPRDQIEGSGMGLAMVKKIVESQGGAIRVESSENHGTAFYFTWPKQAPKADKKLEKLADGLG